MSRRRRLLVTVVVWRTLDPREPQKFESFGRGSEVLRGGWATARTAGRALRAGATNVDCFNRAE